MAAGETARLLASLELKDNLTKGVNTAIGSIGKLEGSISRIGAHAQRGIGNAVHNIAMLGVAATAALTGAVILGIRSLEDLARTQAQTNAVIASTGGKAGVSAAAVRDYAESLENLTTVDDKVIQDGENMLLTFTGIGKAVFPRATKAALNMAVAMAGGNVEAVDLKASAIQLGKALNDPVKGITALRKVGVAFTEAQQKQIKALVKAGDVLGAQKIILKELEVEFGKAGEAAGKGPGAVWRRLQDVGEDLSQSLARGLLPVLEKAGTWLSTKLSDPKVIARIDALGVSLGRAADEVFAFVQKVDFDAIASALGVAVGFAGQLVDVFLGMPQWVQVAVVTGWGLNKLTGGALGDIVGELGKGLIKGVLGINAGVVNVKAGVVNGVGGAAAGATAAGKGGIAKVAALATKVFIVGAAIGVFAELKGILDEQSANNRAQAQDLTTQTTTFAGKADPKDLANAIRGIGDVQRKLLSELSAEGIAFQLDIDGVRTAIESQKAILVDNLARSERSVPPVTNVTVKVNVTAAQVSKSIVIQNRFGPPGGSREHASGTGPLP